MSTNPDLLPVRLDQLTKSFHATIQVLRGMEAIAQTPPPEDIGPEMIDASFNALIAIGDDQDAGAGAFARKDIDFAAPYLAALSSKSVARAMLLKPTQNAFDADPVAQTVNTELAGLRDRMDELATLVKNLDEAFEKTTRFKGALFSQAADSYIAKLTGAHGHGNEEVSYYTNRKIIFIALCGDRPVDSYTLDDLQAFVNQIAWLPPNVTKARNQDIRSALLFIEENRRLNGPGLAQKTIKNSYLSRIKTILRTGCARAHVPFVAGEGRILMPKRAAPPKRRPPADLESVGKIIAAGVRSGMLLEAMLPVLGILTGRRLALLVNMRREDIIRINDVWVVVPNSHVMLDGEWVRVPFKTNESLDAYVLHPLLAECGFIDWTQKQKGFVFSHIMRAKDPADAAQKRMGRLFRSVGEDPRLVGTFHALRHAKISNDRSVKLPSRLIRAQVGHELGDVHDNYGGLSVEDLRQLRDVPLPAGVDWNVFSTIDFEKLALKRPVGGRPCSVKQAA